MFKMISSSLTPMTVPSTTSPVLIVFKDSSNIANSSKDIFSFVNGFVNSLNNNVFLLNDFVEIFNNSLENLIIKAYSDENINIVTPFSNLIFDYEELSINKKNLTYDGIATLIKRCSNNNSYHFPLINNLSPHTSSILQV